MTPPTIFDPKWIKDGFSSRWCRKGITHTLRPASHFKKDMKLSERENTVTLGLLLSVATPNKGNAYGLQMSTTNGNKRIKIQANYAFIMIFADLLDLPNCFAIILQRKLDFQNLFNAKANCEYISIGDPVCFIEPAPTDDKLGEVITIVKSPQFAVCLNYDAGWPKRDLIIAQQNRQVAFHIDEKKIAVSSISLKGGNERVGCNHYMCDRQNIKCQGCFGQSPTLFPIVLQCDITVEDVPDWNQNKENVAGFANFRSWRFSNLFFVSLSSMSGMDADDFDEQQYAIRGAVKKIVTSINSKHGWTIIGWHRRGVTNVNSDDGDVLLANNTAGHISYLMPTDSTDMDSGCEKYDATTFDKNAELPAADNQNNEPESNPETQKTPATQEHQQQSSDQENQKKTTLDGEEFENANQE
jgi:hypothetical protein